MDKMIIQDYMERYFGDRYTQVFELMTRDAEKVIKKYLKEIRPMKENKLWINYKVYIKPKIEIRAI